METKLCFRAVGLYASLAAVLYPAQSIAQPQGGAINIGQLCNAVNDQLIETEPSAGTKFAYQTKLFKAAGVDVGRDNKDIISEKMKLWWSANQHYLKCNLLGSNVRNGHILKLAVEKDADDFITDVARRWRLDLNFIDEDGTTVLDWIDSEIAKSVGTNYEVILSRYHMILTDYGAKNSKDL